MPPLRKYFRWLLQSLYDTLNKTGNRDNLFEGDYPDSACEYLLPDMDYVFISGSAFVNKTMPRLLTLASNAHTVVLGPSTPASPALLHAGATTVISFASAHPARLEDGLAGRSLRGMYDAGMRVQLSRA